MATVSWLRRRRREEASTRRDGAGCEQDDGTLAAAAKGNPEAFTALYQRYIGPVYRFSYVRLGTAQEAEDAASRVFARALAGLRLTLSNIYDPQGQLRYSCEQMRRIVESVR